PPPPVASFPIRRSRRPSSAARAVPHPPLAPSLIRRSRRPSSAARALPHPPLTRPPSRTEIRIIDRRPLTRKDVTEMRRRAGDPHAATAGPHAGLIGPVRRTSGSLSEGALMSVLDREAIIAAVSVNRWLIPPAALAIHLSIGQAYAFSVFKNPLAE